MNIYGEFQKAFIQIENSLDESVLKEFQTSAYSDLHRYHFELGLWIRNTLLQEETTIYRILHDLGFSQRDDMSSFLTNVFYVYLHAKAFMQMQDS